MRKILINQCRIRLTLEVKKGERFLVAAERKEKEPTRPVTSGGKAYLPGSSLRGVLRSRAEYIAALLGQGNSACRLFDPDMPDCGQRFEERMKKAEGGGPAVTDAMRYAEACPVCQLFGHVHYRSRLRIPDFTLAALGGEHSLTHVAIDRMTGGSATRKLYEIVYRSGDSYTGELVIENFMLWQLGLVGMLLQDLDDGLIRIGHKQTSGAGRVYLKDISVELRYLGDQLPTGAIWGMQALMKAVSPEYFPNEPVFHDKASLNVAFAWAKANGIPWNSTVLNGDTVNQLWSAARKEAQTMLKEFRLQTVPVEENTAPDGQEAAQ